MRLNAFGWRQLDDGYMTEVEYRTANSISKALDHGASMVQAETLDAELQPDTTVLVIERPTERIMLVIRKDRSTLVATDDIYGMEDVA